MPVSHAAHDSLFATTEQLQMPHTAVCQSHTAHDSLFATTEQLQMPHNCMPGCESILNVIAGWLICVWILFMWYQNMKASCMVVFRDEETFETAAAVLSRESRTNCLTWEVM